MGCDIHIYAERRNDSGQYYMAKFDFSALENRSYGTFAWLAGVRNYSGIIPISEPRGIPNDLSEGVLHEKESWDGDGHNHSWLSVAELMMIDYNQIIEDRRHTVQTGPNSWNGCATCEVSNGVRETLGNFLGASIIAEIQQLHEAGIDRIVFWFDN